jgi:hypothetical protein
MRVSGWPCLIVGLACWMMGTEKLISCTIGKKIFCTGLTGAAQAEQNLLYQHVSPNKPIKEGSLSFVLPESLFTSVAIGWQGPPLSVSLVGTVVQRNMSICPLAVLYLLWGLGVWALVACFIVKIGKMWLSLFSKKKIFNFLFLLH